MSHFAKINESGAVIAVLVGDNSMPNEGYDWFVENLGGTWVKTSYNAATNGFRKNYASIGFTYDEGRDAFIAPKPYPSWRLDESTCTWKPPVAYPQDDKIYQWNEETLSWVEIQ